MSSKWAKAGIVVLTTGALLVQSGLTTAITPTVEAATTVSVAKQVVKLSITSTLVVEDAQFLMQDQGRVLSFRVNIKNNGKSSLSLNDYWIRLKTVSGKSYTINLLEADKTKKSVAPGSSQTVTYYAIVDKTTKLSDFKFEIIKWDFSVAGYERRLGTIQYPVGASDMTKVFAPDYMLFQSAKIKSAIKTYAVTKDQNNVYLTINYLLENTGLNATDLTNLNLFIQTSGLAVYKVDTSFLSGMSLAAGERKIVTLQTVLPLGVLGKSLSLIAASSNESSKMYIPVAALAIPAIKTPAPTPVAKSRSVLMSGQPINTFVDTAMVGETVSGKTEVSLQYAMRNVGTEALAYPELTFYLYTADGISYPLTFTKDESATKLLPQIREVLSLTGQVPSTVKLDKAQLIVRSGVKENSSGYVIGNYLLKSQQSQQGTIGSSYKLNDYSVSLKSINRTAATNSDVLVAELAITNKAASSKSIPNLSGYFLVNGVKLAVDTTKIALDNSITIAPNETYNIAVYANVPFTTAINNVSFALTETTGSDASSTTKLLYQFNAPKVSEVPNQSTDKPYQILNKGSLTDATLRRSVMFEGDSGNYFYTEFEVVNKEARANVITPLAGYIKDSLGETVPVTFAKFDQKVMSNGKVLLSAWTKVSKNFDPSSFDFIVGRAVTKASGNAGETSDAVVVNPVSYKMTFDGSTNTQKTLTNIPFAGYSFSMRNVQSTLNVEGLYTVTGVKLAFNYDLVKDPNYDYIAGDHKLQFEWVDQGTGKTTYTKQYAIGTAETGETLLKEAKDSAMSFVFEDPEVQMKIQKYENYVLNIYDVFQGSKILVATKEMKWFVVES
ncbi:DUF4352 domain-containing protein [Paenibacillus sp. N4]|uniref:DUF4352 domain-containing protein n=1 Tax=Paenibacillus vietnamensis TaxID=2590547 RepID=UPI001CD078A2|nr:DUF4352 domain-containing protein [Paenibacillus vietnamensis]MCA0757525.1 DUF4352 domain-containing protein [Paenibacillus vietnamensis]